MPKKPGKKPAKKPRKPSKALQEKSKLEFIKQLEETKPNAVHEILEEINLALASGKISGWGEKGVHMAMVEHLINFLAKAQFTPKEMKIYHDALKAGKKHFEKLNEKHRDWENERIKAAQEHLLALHNLKVNEKISKETFETANKAFSRRREDPEVESARKKHLDTLKNLLKKGIIDKKIYQSGVRGLAKLDKRKITRQWRTARKAALKSRFSFLEELHRKGEITEDMLKRLKPAVSDYSVVYSVPCLLNVNLEGSWVKNKKTKELQSKLRKQIINALKRLEPERFKRLHFFEPLQLFSGIEEVLSIAERKYAFPGELVDWPSLHKSLHLIAEGKPYPELRKRFKVGKLRWKMIKPRFDQRWEAIKQMAFHPSKKDFDVIERVLREAIRKGRKQDAFLVDACYYPLAYNTGLIEGEKRKKLAALLRQALGKAEERGIERFPVYGKTMEELVTKLDPKEGRKLKEEKRKREEQAKKARQQAKTRLTSSF